ncbi:polysaccharide deacetylase family protein [Paenibacillus tarimensis]
MKPSHLSDRLVIINADDLGITRSTNQSIVELFQERCITSASIMMPCSAAYEAAKLCNQTHSANIGVHLTLTSAGNHDCKPVFRKRILKSLITKEGYFPHDASAVELNADSEEVRIELEAQIQMAVSHGIEPTHLDSHAGSIMGLHHGRDFLEIVFDLCEKFGLPFNLPLRTIEQPFFSSAQKELFAKRIESAKSRGILLIDDLIALPYHSAPDEGYDDIKKELMNQIINLRPGITQIVAHPSIATPELISFTPHYKKREMEYRLFRDPEIKERFQKENIQLISWRFIRDIQRKTGKEWL